MNKIKNLLFSLSIIISCSANGQKEEGFKCNLLDKAIKTKVFLTNFYICEVNEEVIIIDTSQYFTSCNFSQECNTKLFLSNQADSLKSLSAIVLYKIDIIKNIFKLYFYRPRSGVSVILKLKRKKRNVKLVDYKIGAF